MQHRHLSHRRLTLAALDDLIENGTLADWRPVLARVRRDPEGPVASRLVELLTARDYGESGALWQLFLNDARARGRAGAAIRLVSGARKKQAVIETDATFDSAPATDSPA